MIYLKECTLNIKIRILIELRFTLLMKINKTKKVDKWTSNLLVKVKLIFYTKIS